jgi:hypothetical protein
MLFGDKLIKTYKLKVNREIDHLIKILVRFNITLNALLPAIPLTITLRRFDELSSRPGFCTLTGFGCM